MFLLAGCRELTVRRAKIPSALSVLVETWQGEPLSLLLELRRNSRDQLDVRVAEGAQVADGRRLWRFEETPEGVRFEDRVEGSSVTAPEGTHLVALRQRYAWIGGKGEIFRCDIRNGSCAPAALPTLHLDHPGPGAGFRVELVDGSLRLFLPQEPAPEGITLASGIARVIGVYWVRDETGEAERTVNRAFRGRARVHAVARPIHEDGDLHDWEEAFALVVEAPWQLQSGADGWKGERDASFSVAATWTAESVCFAGRVRDNVFGEEDRVVLNVAGVVETVMVRTSAGVRTGWYNASWERCVATARLPTLATLPFAVSYFDHDPGASTTVLASAPERDGVPLGELVLDAPR